MKRYCKALDHEVLIQHVIKMAEAQQLGCERPIGGLHATWDCSNMSYDRGAV